MLNRFLGIGRLTNDPELRYTQNGTAVARFRIAIDRPYLNEDGNRDADFISIITWGKLAELCSQHLTKGRLVCVDGRLQIREFEKNGEKRRAAEIIASAVHFLDRPKDEGGQDAGADDEGWYDDDVPY